MADKLHSELIDTATALELHQAKINAGSSNPGTPEFEGQVYARIGSDDRHLSVGYSGNYEVVGGVCVLRYENPAGNYTPDYAGQFYYDRSTDKFYLADGTTSDDWIFLAYGSPAVPDTGGGS